MQASGRKPSHWLKAATIPRYFDSYVASVCALYNTKAISLSPTVTVPLLASEQHHCELYPLDSINDGGGISETEASHGEVDVL